MAEINVEKIWDSVRDDKAGDAKYAEASPDFKAKLGHAAGEARQGRSTGIAGLEKFEEAVAKAAGATLVQSGVDAGRVEGAQQPTVRGEGMPPEPDKEESKVSGKEKALKDAAGAKSRVEAGPEHSPDAPSAARPMAAEAPANKAKPRSKAGKSK